LARLLSGHLGLQVCDEPPWLDGPSTARSAYRYSELEEMKNYQTGFRLARDL